MNAVQMSNRLFVLILVITNANARNCPLWTTPQNDSCKCGSWAFGLVQCEDNKGAVAVTNCYCMTAGDSNTSAVIGACQYACHPLNNSTKYSLEVNTTDDLDDITCGPYKRTGVLCGKCVEGYGLPIYSYGLSCVECSHYKYNWLKYIAVAFMPVTLFYVIILTFRISATSGVTAGYVTICQMTSIDGAVSWYLKERHAYVRYIILFFSIWNLDFRAFFRPFCLHPRMSALHVFMMNYAVALYPLVLILLTYVAVKLHDRVSLVVWLCKPLYACLLKFRKEWKIKNSLVQALATLYILSYVRMMNISTNILSSVYLIDMTSQKKAAYYYDPTLPFLGREHYPYAIGAVSFIVIFNILPLLLLCLYPCHCFHKCLNKTGCRWQALHVFMDAILGAYSHRPRERRHFGAVYIIVRILHLLASTQILASYLPITSYILIATIALVAIFQPYKSKWHNAIDVILFLALLNCYLMIIYIQDAAIIDPRTKRIQVPIYHAIFYSGVLVLVLYGIIMVAYVILPKKLIQKILKQLFTLTHRNSNSSSEESLPFRMEHSEEAPLIYKN